VSGDGAGAPAPDNTGSQPIQRGRVTLVKLFRRMRLPVEDLTTYSLALFMLYFIPKGMTEAIPVTQVHGSANILWGVAVLVLLVHVFSKYVGVSTDPELWSIGWAFRSAAIGVIATGLAIVLAYASVIWLVQHHQIVTLKPAQSELAIKDVVGKAVYEILDAIPILNIPSTMGWEDPIPDPAAWGGIIFLLVKLVVVVALGRRFSKLWLATRRISARTGAATPAPPADEQPCS
jgi:hypothetical protein